LPFQNRLWLRGFSAWVNLSRPIVDDE
jgi:hypothetical protein